MRALDADGMSPALLAVILIAGLGGVWCSWLVAARVPVYQISESARLEIDVHPVAATVAGRVTSTSLTLGREVHEGDVLLEIDAGLERLQTAEERTRLAAFVPQTEALQREIAAQEEAIVGMRRANDAALAEAGQKLAATRAAEQQADDKLKRVQQLADQGLSARSEFEIARAEQQARHADTESARAGIERMRAEQSAAERDRRGRIAALARERANLQGLQSASTSSVARLEHQADLRVIRASVSGRLGEVNPVQVGAVVAEGVRLASIIPNGQVRAVAEFAPPAVGRLRTGQRARVRLDGFPWTQYGHLDGTVARVATETREQRIRVELLVRQPPGSAIPIQHGVPGVVEVEVERVPPVALLLRSLGYAVSNSTAPAQDPAPPPSSRRP